MNAELHTRDNNAGVKLLGGMIRLDQLRPDGFTAQELADHAGVNQETARYFIRSKRFAEVVPRGRGRSTSGRPQNTYKLLEEGRWEILRRLAEVSQAVNAEAPPSEASERLLAPLRLVDLLLCELEEDKLSIEDRESTLREVRVELSAASADESVLLATPTPHGPAFSRTLRDLRKRMNAVERASTVGALASRPVGSKADGIAWLVDQFGAWLEGAAVLRNAAEKLDRAVVLFDATAEDANPMVSRLLTTYRDHQVPVAVFDVLAMDEEKPVGHPVGRVQACHVY